MRDRIRRFDEAEQVQRVDVTDAGYPSSVLSPRPRDRSTPVESPPIAGAGYNRQRVAR